jgi:hypothetical protein
MVQLFSFYLLLLNILKLTRYRADIASNDGLNVFSIYDSIKAISNINSPNIRCVSLATTLLQYISKNLLDVENYKSKSIVINTSDSKFLTSSGLMKC